MVEHKFKPKKCICGLSLSGKVPDPGTVREQDGVLIGLCPVCTREVPVSEAKKAEPEAKATE